MTCLLYTSDAADEEDSVDITYAGLKIICEFSGSKTFNCPYWVAPIIFILGIPILVPGISCITYTIDCPEVFKSL